MIVVVSSAGVSLEDVTDLKRFAASSALDMSTIAALLLDSGWGRASEKEGHVAISVSAIREAAVASGNATDDWNSAFAGMLAYAESKDWMVDPGHILAHVENQP